MKIIAASLLFCLPLLCEESKSEPKVLSATTKLAIKDAQIRALKAQLALVQTEQYYEYLAAQRGVNETANAAQAECGSPVDANLNCTAPIPKPEAKK